MKLPKGWKRTTVGSDAMICNSLRFPISQEERALMAGAYPYYGPTGVLTHINEYRVEGEYTLIGEDGDHFLKHREKPMTLLPSGRFNVNNHAHLMKGSESCITKWLYYFFMYADLSPFLTRQGVGRYKLTKNALEKIPLLLPPLPEQRKIADILSTWDESLEKLDALISAKERRRKGLMQQLLTGKRRARGAAAWKVTRLSEVAEERIARNRENFDRSRLYAVTKAEGMVPMRERVQGATVDRCKVVEKGWFAYNPMRINIGSIARWEGENPVMVSGDYVVFSTDEERLLSDYFNQVRRSSAWCSFVGASGNGSVRIRIWFDDLGHFKFPLPPVNEQRAIADILAACDDELRLLRDRRAAVERQKRGLMQRLLTGKVRVKASGENGHAYWESE